MKATLALTVLAFAVFEAFIRGFDAGKAVYECHLPHPTKGD